MRTRITVIGAAIGLIALTWLVWTALSLRPANLLSNEAKTPPSNGTERGSDGLSATEEYATRTADSEQFPNGVRLETTIEIRQYPEEGQPSNTGNVILIHLDNILLRAHDISIDDVMKAFVGCFILSDLAKRIDPPPEVVFVTHLGQPELYENIIVKADAEGNIVRIKDVATVEFGP